MWLSPPRRAHSFFLNTCRSFTDSHPSSTLQKLCFGRIQDYAAGVTVMLVRGVKVPELTFWHGRGSSRRSSPVDPWR
eukprot:4217648-Pyramimonas_sp.AAC.1